MFGCHWPLMPALTAELFGLRHFAANQTPISLATALGSFVLSQQLAGRLYQSHVPPGEANCYGKYCFRYVPVTSGDRCSSSWLRYMVNGLVHKELVHP